MSSRAYHLVILAVGLASVLAVLVSTTTHARPGEEGGVGGELIYAVEFQVYDETGLLVGYGRIIYTIGSGPGQASYAYKAGVLLDPRLAAYIVESLGAGRYSPEQPIEGLEPLFPVIAYNSPGNPLPVVCRLDEMPVTGVELRTGSRELPELRGNAWITPGMGVVASAVLLGEAAPLPGAGSLLVRLDINLAAAEGVVCGERAGPTIAGAAATLSAASLIGGAAVLIKRFREGWIAESF